MSNVDRVWKSSLTDRGGGKLLERFPKPLVEEPPLAHWQTIVALFWQTYDLLQILLKCCLTVFHKFFNRTMQKPVFSRRLFGRLFFNSIVAIRKLERHVRKALHCGSKQQQSLPDEITLVQWFPTGGSRSSGCGVANNSLNSLLKSRLRKSTFRYISKTETQTELSEVHITSIIIPIWFLLYSFNRPDCGIEYCVGRANPLQCVLNSVRGGCGVRNCLCG